MKSELLLKDLQKKFIQLRAMKRKTRGKVLAGLIDGLAGATVPHPYSEDPDLSSTPPIRPCFDPDYEAGYDVGETWVKIAHLDCAGEEIKCLDCGNKLTLISGGSRCDHCK